MHCPVCGGNPVLDAVKEVNKTLSEVTRQCCSCHLWWVFSYVGSVLLTISEKGMENEEHGFKVCCPCGAMTSYHIKFRPAWWKCQKCGKSVPRDKVVPIGDYSVPDPSSTLKISSGAYQKKKFSTSKSHPSTLGPSKPLPEGAVDLASLAANLEVEPKRLRSWLRKVDWRPGSEHGSRYVFSQEEAKEIRLKFRR